MRVLSFSAVASLLFLATALAVPPAAQTTPGGSAFQNQFPDPLSYQPPIPEAPELRIVSVKEIVIPGPLESGPRLVDGMIEVRTAAGRVRTAWDGSAPPAIDAGPGAAADERAATGWTLSADRTHRVKAYDDRFLLAEKTCPGCAGGWSRRWRLRVAGLAQVPPLITQQRVYYGAADNRVYGVRRKNGHRAWVTPMDGRVLQPLAMWIDERADIAALLVIPEPGEELVVLDAAGGRPAFRHRLPKEGERFVGPALSTPDGRVVLARQGYSPADASLVVLEIEIAEPKTPESDDSSTTGYNLPTSDEAIPARSRPSTRRRFTAAGLM